MLLFQSVIRKRQAVQNCSGSSCNQNNGAGVPFGLAAVAAPGAFVGPAPAVGATQNCQGSSCNQNNGGVAVAAPGAFVDCPDQCHFSGCNAYNCTGCPQNCDSSACNVNYYCTGPAVTFDMEDGHTFV